MESKATTYNPVGAVLIAALMISLVPLTTGAQGGEDKPERPAMAERVDFCDNLDTVRENALSKLGERKGGADRTSDFEAKRDARLAELETRRTERDGERDAKYDTMRERASTDEQSAAIETFVSTIEGLVDDRRAAMDVAISDFEAAVSALHDDRLAAVDTKASEIELDMGYLFDDAEDSCEEGTSSREVRADLQEDMKLLRDSIRGDRESYSFKDDLAAARDTRKAAVDSAKADFQAGLEAAKEALKAAFSA